ncbi:MAG: alpha/beta hydrolase [Treponema sp.]|jgi:pimeloyl-ACP methyl ester carboxylesterase|nr:alpha/beta hydrolase [Treponema sp.]
MDLNGIKVNYFSAGQGEAEKLPAVLFLHGWGSEFSSFKYFLDSISPYYRVFAPDLPGFGQSAEPPEAWSMDDYADFVLDFMKELTIDRVILIGHSFGGRISIKLAARRNLPVSIEKIVLVDSAGIRRKRTVKQNMELCFYKAVRRFLSVEFVRRRYPGFLEKWRNKHASPDYLNATPRMRECLVKVVNEDLTPCLSEISCPSLLIWGEQDYEVPLEDGKIMERLIPDAGLVTLKNAGHYPFADQGFVFLKVLDSFLNIKRNP